MIRPVPNSKFLITTAQWVQQSLKSRLVLPTLLAAQQWANFALVAPAREPELHVLDRKSGKLLKRLPLPPETKLATDLTAFTYSPDGLNVAAYDPRSDVFLAWSMNDGELLLQAKGVGQMAPAIAFMPGGRIAVCDGANLDTHQLGGSKLYSTPISNDLRSLVLFAPPSPKPALVAVSVFRKGLGHHSLESLRIEENNIVARHDGPMRRKPENPKDKKIVLVHHLLNIPGSTARILILLEEESWERHAEQTDWEYDIECRTRLHAIDPGTGRFLKGEMEVEGRHCMELEGGEMYLIDEMGRKRRIAGFPLRLEAADWRLMA